MIPRSRSLDVRCTEATWKVLFHCALSLNLYKNIEAFRIRERPYLAINWWKLTGWRQFGNIFQNFTTHWNVWTPQVDVKYGWQVQAEVTSCKKFLSPHFWWSVWLIKDGRADENRRDGNGWLIFVEEEKTILRWHTHKKVHVTKRSGPVMSDKGCNLCMWSLGRRKKPFSCVWGMVTNCKPDDPKASRILTSEVFCKNMDGSYSHLHFSKIKHAHLVLWPKIKSYVFFINFPRTSIFELQMWGEGCQLRESRGLRVPSADQEDQHRRSRRVGRLEIFSECHFEVYRPLSDASA